MKIVIVATSSTVPPIELKMGAQKLRNLGFEVEIHPICRAKELFYAGSAKARAKALLEVALRKDVDVIWCARGGYGANQLLPHLDRAKKNAAIRNLSQKILIGFSDITALFQYARHKWKWRVLHFPMPASHSFFLAENADWKTVLAWIRVKDLKPAWDGMKLQTLTRSRGSKDIDGELIGGNLAVWTALAGTPYQSDARGKILFLEEIGENLSRVDRMLEQLKQAGMLTGARAIVLGDFMNCEDLPPRFLAREPRIPDGERTFFKSPPQSLLKDLRPKIEKMKALRAMFERLGAELGIPVYGLLPVGHGPHYSPLPIGARLKIVARTGQVSLDLRAWLS